MMVYFIVKEKEIHNEGWYTPCPLNRSNRKPVCEPGPVGEVCTLYFVARKLSVLY